MLKPTPYAQLYVDLNVGARRQHIRTALHSLESAADEKTQKQLPIGGYWRKEAQLASQALKEFDTLVNDFCKVLQMQSLHDEAIKDHIAWVKEQMQPAPVTPRSED